MDCGKPYDDFPMDSTLPHNQWLMIHDNFGGLLCAGCMVKRASSLPDVVAMRMRIDFRAAMKAGPCDCGAGIVEAMARALWHSYSHGDSWDVLEPKQEQVWCKHARAALTVALDHMMERIKRDGLLALAVAYDQKMCKQKGERDTEFVKRIVGSYFDQLRKEIFNEEN